jgi:hypothetical protein
MVSDASRLKGFNHLPPRATDMIKNRQLRRHRPYFPGWAQAFGDHAIHDEPDAGRRWLFGDGQLGLILSPSLRAQLCGDEEAALGGILADQPGPPASQVVSIRMLARNDRERSRASVLDLSKETLRIGRLRLRACPDKAVDGLHELFDGAGELHLFESYHLIYPTGTRILTLSRHLPLRLIYRELPPTLMRCAPNLRPAESEPHLRDLACA